jgi:hypothetical protein
MMNAKPVVRWAVRGLAAGVAVALASYGGYVLVTWTRYGGAKPANTTEEDSLDRFMPFYEIVERHEVQVAAPAETTLAAACEQDLQDSAVVKSIFKARELLLRSQPDDAVRPRGLLAETKALGWGVLAEIPGREIIMGAVTQAWEPNVVFRAIPPESFADFNEPGYVKIVWTLRADPVGERESIFRTETRAVTTDATARAKFRWYWSKVSPGIRLIRRMMLGPLKKEAERRAREAASAPQPGAVDPLES